MRKAIVLCAIMVTSNIVLQADLGSCLMYHAKFYLTSGEVFTGSFEVCGEGAFAVLGEDGKNEYCSDEGLMMLLKELQESDYFWGYSFGFSIHENDLDNIPVVKNFYNIQPKGMNKRMDFQLPLYGFVAREDLIMIDPADLDKVVFWDVEYAQRSWYSSEVVIGNQKMIDTVLTERYWNLLYVDDASFGLDTLTFSTSGIMSGYVLINYNARNNEEELKRLARLKFQSLDINAYLQKVKKEYGIEEHEPVTNEVYDKFEVRWKQKIQGIKDWFWKRGILVVYVWSGC